LRLLSGAAVAWPLLQSSAFAQRARPAFVGFIGNDIVGGGAWAEALWGRLGELGWNEGRNLTTRSYWVGGDPANAHAAAAALVASGVDVIVAINAIYVGAARRATAKVPIVFTSHGDPIGAGHVESLSRPGGNVTGVTHMQPEVTAKALQVLHEGVPRLRRIAVLWSSDAPPHHNVVPLVLAMAQRLGITATTIDAPGGADMVEVVARSRAGGADAMLIVQGPVFSPHYARLAGLAIEAGLVTASTVDGLARAGGLLSFGPDFIEMSRRGAELVDKILRGASPANVPVEQPAKFYTVVNLATARALKVTLTPEFLARADEVIE
jgi:putative ABC transport system substrate-binding protein